MDYRQHIRVMFEHLVKNKSEEEVDACINSMCDALVFLIVSFIPDHDELHKAIHNMHENMQRRACELHQKHYPDADVEHHTVDAETFLRDHFKPEKFNG